jgi:hypothetical protein
MPGDLTALTGAQHDETGTSLGRPEMVRWRP